VLEDEVRVAAVQMVSGPQVSANLEAAQRLIGEAAAAGARLVVLPENFALMGLNETDKLAVAERPGDGTIQAFLSAQARLHALWLVGGTLPMACEDAARVRAACLVYDPRGACVARFDKMHLFDVEVAAGESYCESATLEPGERPVALDTPAGRLGLSVCYDLRFPELFRHLLGQGMEVVALPAAFTAATGAAHWQVLVRARAIENQCYVIAAAQGGVHANGRQTHGESMIVDPWGTVMAARAKGEGVVVATLSRSHLQAIRRRFPALDHRRL
jgi:deaminated glutathione amidase